VAEVKNLRGGVAVVTSAASGIHSIIHRMIDSDEPGHVVNTASFGGLITGTENPKK